MENIMTSNEVFLEIQHGLNKLASGDYPNLEAQQVMYAFNTETLLWVRRQLHGSNIFKEAREQSIRRVDDLQILLTSKKLSGTQKLRHFQTELLPKDYLEFNRFSVVADKEPCKGVNIVSSLIEESNVDEYLASWDKQPSFKFEETFHTISSNRIHCYHNNDFAIKEGYLVYYRKPKYVEFEGAYLGDGSIGTNATLEFKDDIVRVLIKETISALAAAIESPNQFKIAAQAADESN